MSPARALPHHRATPTLTGGRESERTPCAAYPGVYDALVDVGGTGRSVNPEAVEAARNLCATCLLRTPEVARACWARATEAREPWLAVMRGTDLREPPTRRKSCGKPHGAEAHTRRGERACDDCRKAAAERARRRKQAAKETAA